MKNKVVLAYSGGLDTSIMIPWLKDHYDCDVIAMCANLGQADELDGLEEKALATGASKVFVEDLRETFITDYIYPTMQAGAIYERQYLLGTSFGRPLIAKRQVDIAKQEGATMVAHGATGKGNDQVRFELTFMALAPELTIVAPWKDDQWTLHSREDCLAYADEKGVPVAQSKARIYSEDRNIWHISHEGGVLEDPANEAPSDVFTISSPIEDAVDTPEYVVIAYEKGVPVSVNGTPMGPVELLTQLNALGAAHGIGQVDMVENRLVGMKSRGVYETPGGTILYETHRMLEQLVLDRDTALLKQRLAIEYAQMVYDGRWFCPAKQALDAFVQSTQKNMTGTVKVKLYKGNIVPAGVASKQSLYHHDLASFSDTDLYNQQDATGFIRLFGLPMKVNGMVGRS
ncbi:MAG: argininosuccinate synthase [Candidatus Margulisbacteria bacterium]|nr:argininosuccinate synthase [Candidatus Margulisiibacteriota bacterium]